MVALNNLFLAVWFTLNTVVVSTNSFPENVNNPELSEWWAGHQITVGQRKVPFIGKIDTRLDSYYLARFRQTQNGVFLEQKTCATRHSKVGGVSFELDDRRTPELALMLAPNVQAEANHERNQFVGLAKVGWAEEDRDRDGHPGMTVRVDAPLCSGELYLANQTVYQTKLNIMDSKHVQGEVSISLSMRVIDTNKLCLSLFTKDSNEQTTGVVSYRAVPAGSTCDSFPVSQWPARAYLNSPSLQ